ncbi:rhodanese-like domain-containing protein [Geomonas ferrireducens]|uniref:rhodanese-like domain-containing protein n=1 Tax=Geomonas ferrireducens TaxID=2570227 RepID=UPI0010A8A7F8|nr:rhodanese-like domain-containing protein [Geomonas ferrireducens]
MIAAGIDIGSPEEYQVAPLPAAVNIIEKDFEKGVALLPKEKGGIVYCNGGGRSYSAYRKLMKLAYPSIYQAILSEWKEAGLPVVKSQL